MARRLHFRILNFNYINLRPTLSYSGNFHKKEIHTEQIPVKEVQIPVRWGHIAGKLWGNNEDRPILALHGWQDNAGTWDPLAPMLCKNRSILAIDFPGHGLSSWIPPGMQYYPWALPGLILYLKEHFKWDKISLLCHSLGSLAGLRYACVFPDEVDFYVAIDSLVQDDYDLHLVIGKYPKLLRKLQITQSRLGKEPPSYTLEEITKIWHNGTSKSVDLESVKYLSARGIKPSKLNPNKYYFSRDSRLKHSMFIPESKLFVEALVKRLQCPTLYVKAINSPFASDAFSVEMREVMEKNNDKFESHFLPGTHHVHLNNPELVAPLIINFLQKHNFIQ